MHNSSIKNSWTLWIVIFLVSATLILLQSALTRILSAASTYHATFFVISFVMLGLAKSSIEVYQKVNSKLLDKQLIKKALLQGAIYSVAAYFLFSHLLVPVLVDNAKGLIFIFSAIFFYFPFERCGFVIASILYLERKNAGWIYWGDLLGAAITAAILTNLLDIISSPLAFFLSAILLSSCALMIPYTELTRHEMKRSYFSISVFLSSSVLFLLALIFPSVYFLPFPDSHQTESLEWDEWNSLARIAVFSENSTFSKYISSGWGMSTKFEGTNPPLKWLNIDSGAGTQIINIKNELEQDQPELEFLKWDVTSAGYEFSRQLNAPLDNVFIIGGGGGRDIITAALYGSNNIHVAELNPLIVYAVNDVFGDFSGKPYSLDSVRLTIGEGRHTLSRVSQSFDLIQMSMIDTDSASIAGSFALTENSLYTLEAFELFINRLSVDGIFSLSRWWLGGAQGETGRAIRMVLQTLKNIGIKEPSEHMVMFYNQGDLTLPVTTTLVRKNRFTEAEIEKCRRLAEEKGYELIWPLSENPKSQLIQKLAEDTFNPRSEKVYDLTIPTDDKPFFFNLKRPFSSWVEALKSRDVLLGSPVTLLFALTFITLLLACISLIYRPAIRISRQLPVNSKLSKNQMRGMILYFAGIGVGFMFIEIAMLQRFSIFLGHPNYSLSIILFSLLLFSSLGSLFSKHFYAGPKTIFVLFLLLCILTLWAAIYLPDFLLSNYGLELGTRKVLSVGLLAAPSLLMGMFLPLGISRLVQINKEGSVPLAWAINGFFSVMGSAIAIVIAVFFGFTTLLISAMIAYSMTAAGILLLKES
jgi:hypothetical protein